MAIIIDPRSTIDPDTLEPNTLFPEYTEEYTRQDCHLLFWGNLVQVSSSLLGIILGEAKRVFGVKLRKITVKAVEGAITYVADSLGGGERCLWYLGGKKVALDVMVLKIDSEMGKVDLSISLTINGVGAQVEKVYQCLKETFNLEEVTVDGGAFRISILLDGDQRPVLLNPNAQRTESGGCCYVTAGERKKIIGALMTS